MWEELTLPSEEKASAEKLWHRIQNDNFGDISERLKREVLSLRFHLEHCRPPALGEYGNHSAETKPSSESLLRFRHLSPEFALELWDRQTRARLHRFLRDLILEKTEPGGDFVLMWLPRDKSANWQAFSAGWRDQVKDLRWNDARALNLMNSTQTIDGETVEMRVFKAELSEAKTKKIRTGRPGRPEKYDWFAFDREIMAKLALDGELPPREELRRHMDKWIERWEAQPESSQVRDRIARIYADPRIVPG
jgi:hypothetical protein